MLIKLANVPLCDRVFQRFDRFVMLSIKNAKDVTRDQRGALAKRSVGQGAAGVRPDFAGRQWFIGKVAS
jgi:hypothetical protein